MIGTTLDKYEVLQKVGEGGMATVYRGRHATLDRIVAIKILHPHLSSSVRNRARFAREVEAIERLRHDNILEIFDYSGNDGTDCYLVMEFVEGETLTEMVQRRGRLPSEVACLIGVALCRALGYAHSQGVLHRDVKPDNVMVRVDGVVKLMDFGIARFLDESRVTMTGALVGSPAFMSPEQAREATLDQRSDLFSLGTVLFYLVTGTLPFTGSNPSLILKNVIEGNRPQVAELAPTISATLVDTIERLMSTNPEDRFTRAIDVEQQLVATLCEVLVCAPGRAEQPLATGDVTPPEWSLLAWVRDPDEYEARLDVHLRRTLVDEGRRLLGQGNHLAALRLLNRLLSVDESNAEVLALVQGLHGEPSRITAPRSRGLAWLALLALATAAAAVFAGVRFLPQPEVPPSPVSAVSPLPAPVVQDAPVPPVLAPAEAVATPAVVQVAPPVTPAPRVRTGPTLPAPTPPTPEPPSKEKARVHLNSRAKVADVYLDDKRIGDTREDLVLDAGTHELTLRHPLLEDKVVTVTVAGGETKLVDVELIPRPATLTFDQGYPGACSVRRDATDTGTLESLGWQLVVDRPDRPLSVVLTCPDGRVLKDQRPYLVGATVPFNPGP